MPTYDPILDTEVDAESPITQSLMERMRDNPESVHAGDASVPANKRIKVPQALRTDIVDTLARMAPDGLGGVKWTGGDFAGSGVDGAVTSIVAGVYHCTSLAISAPQTPTGPVTIYCSGAVSASSSITSSYSVRIFSVGNVSLAAVTCRGLEIRTNGNIALTGTVVTNNGLNQTMDFLDRDHIGVGRFFCGGTFSDGSQSITGNDLLAFVRSTAVLAGTWRAVWSGSGGLAVMGSQYAAGAAWPNIYGNASVNGSLGTFADIGDGGPTGGGGGGTGGGVGGNSNTAGGAADPYRSGHRLYAIPQGELRRGGGTGAAGDFGGSAVAGANAGGRISIFVYGALTATGATFNVNGANGTNFGSNDTGGGGAGFARVVSRGNIAGGTITANGGNGGSSNGGDGAGGGAVFAASGYSGSQSVSAAAGTGFGTGTGGTTATDTLSTAQIDDLIDQGIFDV